VKESKEGPTRKPKLVQMDISIMDCSFASDVSYVSPKATRNQQ
jgi:hypothetical protein